MILIFNGTGTSTSNRLWEEWGTNADEIDKNLDVVADVGDGVVDSAPYSSGFANKDSCDTDAGVGDWTVPVDAATGDDANGGNVYHLYGSGLGS